MPSFWQILAIWCRANSFLIYKISTLALGGSKVFWPYESVLFCLSFCCLCLLEEEEQKCPIVISINSCLMNIWQMVADLPLHSVPPNWVSKPGNKHCPFPVSSPSTLLSKISFDKIYNNHRNRYLISYILWIKVHTVQKSSKNAKMADLMNSIAIRIA